MARPMSYILCPYGIVIYGHPLVRFIGSGESTVFLYNVDGETHFDPLVPSTGSPDQAHHIDEAPIDEVSIDEAPIDEAPIDEVPIDEAPIDKAPPLSILQYPKKVMCALLAPGNLRRLARRLQQESSVIQIHSDSSNSEATAAAAAAASTMPGECAVLCIAVYTSSYICSASHCKNAVQKQQQRRKQQQQH